MFLPGTGTDKLMTLLKENSTINRTILDAMSTPSTLSEAIEVAFAGASAGDVLLFSPGFASFGMFVNEYDRNDLFVKLIQSKIHEIE